MKRIILTLVAIAAMLASCKKTESVNGSGSVPGDFRLNITVAELGSGDDATKTMIKDSWAEGDQISIWYDGNTQDNPDLVIEYDGGTWNKYSGKAPSEGDDKYIKAVYNGQVIVASKDSYKFSNNTLTFSIANWTFLTEIQVVVTGITGNASDYALACNKFTPLSGIKYTVTDGSINAITGTKGAAVVGFESEANPGAATFVFATAGYTTGDATADYTIALAGAGTKVYYTPEAKSFQKDTKSIKAIKIDASTFKPYTAGLGSIDKTNGSW